MAGIYIHIPFCKKACTYCNFHFSTSLRTKNEFIPALLKEVLSRRDYLGDKVVNTIYFGGGTPSILDIEELRSVIDTIKQQFVVAPDAELTLESNPDDINAQALLHWKAIGINRLSIGIQSFFEADLRWMNRAHSAAQAVQSIQLAQEAGIKNITIDLIYGTPGLTDSNWLFNLQSAVELGIPHLSCYALTVEPKTLLDQRIRTHVLPDIDLEQQARQFMLMVDFLGDRGFEHYEISNFAKPGWRSRHNSAYWSGEHYLGLGPSAHSFNGLERSWNIANNALYIQGAHRNDFQHEVELITPIMKLNEYLMTSSRTIEGISLNRVAEEFGPGTSRELEAKAKRFVDTGRMKTAGNYLQLTPEGRLFADGIASDLFFD